MAEKRSEKRIELPPNLVVLQNGKVVRVDQWTLWNLVPWMTIQIGREFDPRLKLEGEFFAHIGDPEHGGGSKRGTLQDVLIGLHPRIAKEYSDLFQLENADEPSIRRIGFIRHKIELLPA